MLMVDMANLWNLQQMCAATWRTFAQSALSLRMWDQITILSPHYWCVDMLYTHIALKLIDAIKLEPIMLDPMMTI